MQKEDILRLLSENMERFGINLSPTEIIGKKICIIGEEVENDWSSIIIVTTVTSIESGGADKILEELMKVGPGLTRLHLANGGKLLLKERIHYVGPTPVSDEMPDLFSDEDYEYSVETYFLD